MNFAWLCIVAMAGAQGVWAADAQPGSSPLSNDASTSDSLSRVPGVDERGKERIQWPAGRARVIGHSLVDDHGPFLGLGASYFTALWRCREDPARLERDLAFLARQGFNYYRVLSMVGYYPAWEGLEIAPVAFTSRAGKRVEPWPDYWQQLGRLIDLAYDRHGLRTQVTIFADAQLMPGREARLEHLRRMLAEVVSGREEKILLLEVANEAWQNGFPGAEGIRELREWATFLNERTPVPVAITSNHETADGFERTYAGSGADLATWHFSRDRRPDAGWQPVYDCWDFGVRPGCPPAVSNEPIGPGSSVNAERDPVRLTMAAVFAYVAKLPAYVFHCEAGVFGKTSFEQTPGIRGFGRFREWLPGDLANWERNDGKEPGAPFTVFAGGLPNRYWPEAVSAADGCLRNAGSRRGKEFVCVPIGIRPGGLEVEARRDLRFTARDPVTGVVVTEGTLQRGERQRLPGGTEALLIRGCWLGDSCRAAGDAGQHEEEVRCLCRTRERLEWGDERPQSVGGGFGYDNTRTRPGGDWGWSGRICGRDPGGAVGAEGGLRGAGDGAGRHVPASGVHTEQSAAGIERVVSPSPDGAFGARDSGGGRGVGFGGVDATQGTGGGSADQRRGGAV